MQLHMKMTWFIWREFKYNFHSILWSGEYVSRRSSIYDAYLWKTVVVGNHRFPEMIKLVMDDE